MRVTFLLSLLTGWVLSLCSAADLQGSVVWNQYLTAAEGLSPNTAVELNNGEYRTLIRKDGSFVIPDVTEGTYVLRVLSKTHFFDQIYLTVTPSSIHLKPYHPSMLPVPPTETTPSLPYPIQLVPVVKIQYYEQPQGANIMGLFKNPMVLMLGFTGLMAFAMPKMLASMDLDPEEAKEMAQMQQRIKGFQNTDWSEKLAGALAGKAAGTENAAETVDAQSVHASGVTSSGNVNARRRKGR
ncbi:hypothetical protein NliqN6_1605 [Naganishia liquefaciens]|uniref:ER membrane protein complex subunit 7 beta-sandwich domain-containing protein n=1 Tax=Naganishia liquefaciens TaxID=104408 RepID=A0A8H3TQU3_9TREE|nr:hypothetical protein NliqN6_1605 [Naganishia liquefaciens]